MNTRDYSILHLDKKIKERVSSYIAVLHFTVTVRSSTMNITHTLK